MKILPDGNVCAPLGFLAAGVHVGIRKNPEKLDLAVIYSKVPAQAAGVFTLNQVKAAPVVLSQNHLQQGTAQAIIVNSGNANACTGAQGLRDAQAMVTDTAQALQLAPEQVVVASTGVIGVPLPIMKIQAKIPQAVAGLSTEGGQAAAQAIMTTDTYSKSIAVETLIAGKTVRIGGIAKGSGMIHPNMATLLAFMTTDAAIAPAALKAALIAANQNSFNMITVDGDSSTNDMAVILANGLAENPLITTTDDPNWQIFYEALAMVMTALAKEIARDGEGATKLIEVRVQNAANLAEARIAARAVCVSPLVKTAIFGEDANWGRIACALGSSQAKVDPTKLTIQLGDLVLLKDGAPLPFSEETAGKILAEKNIIITVSLGTGQAAATAWGCDLTHGYIDINAAYRT